MSLSERDAALTTEQERVMVSLDDVHIRFPVHNGSSRSLQLDIMRLLGFSIPEHKRVSYVEALRGISIEFKEGERVGIIGHNGAGKTTILRTIAQAYEPSEGRVQSFGRVTAMTDFTMGMDPEATGRQNVVFRGVFMGMTFDEIEARMDEVIEFSELQDFIDLPVRTYSTGMFLRLAFAVSTLIDPDILLLDEIIAAGDLGFQKKLQGRLERYIEEARLIVLAAHDLGAVRQYCTRVIWMEHGRVKMDGDTETILAAYIADAA